MDPSRTNCGSNRTSDRSTRHAANGSPGTLGLNFERNLCVTSDAPESVHVAFA